MRIRRDVRLFLGSLLLIVCVLTSFVAPALTPYTPDAQDLSQRLTPPGSSAHPFGTDPLGRDLLTRISFGVRVSLIVGIVSVVVAGGIGVPLGLIAGFYGGYVDGVVMRLVDLQLAVPFLVLALAIVAVSGPSLINLVAVLALSGWVVYARVVRGQVLVLRAQEFVTAARALGAKPARILLRHVLPQVMPSVIVVSTQQVGIMILTESSLSFLGLGMPVSIPSLGSIAADGRDYLTTAWWVTTLAGAAIVIIVLGINLFGDWLRDHLDPTVRS